MDKPESGNRWLQRLAAIVVGYLVSLFSALFCMAGIGAGPITTFTAVLVGGALIGALARRTHLFAGRRYLLATCAFVAALTLWIPVVMVTYGFALLGVPLLGLYSLAVLAGWWLGAKLEASKGS